MSERDLLMIPGPIELEPSVLAVLSEKQRGHLDPVFIKRYSRVIKRLRAVLQAPSAQPFVLAGSGTLAMEFAVANLVEPGDAALVVNTGYFSDRMGLALERHGAVATHLRAPPGQVPALDEVERQLASGRFKVMTVTHVDTSTGVLAPVQALAKLASSRNVLVVVDGVCSVGAEALEQEAWGVDVALTGSQKALGAPPGLAVMSFGPRALQAVKSRKQPVRSLYLDLNEWLPIHEAYEAERPSYFATPPVNLISALDVSLGLILDESMPTRVLRHVRVAQAFRAAWAALGLKLLPDHEAITAHSLSAVFYPAGIDVSLVKAVASQGITIAGGLHPELKPKYFRVGHMGAVSSNDVLATVSAIERSLASLGYRFELGAGLAAAQKALVSPVQ